MALNDEKYASRFVTTADSPIARFERPKIIDDNAIIFHELINKYPDELSDDNLIEILKTYHKKLSNDSYQYILHLLPEDKRNIVKPHTFKNKFGL